jgi:hypothetical protein
MFVCEPCHKGTDCKNGMAESFFRSRGECEVCHTPAACLDCQGYKDIPLSAEAEAMVREAEVYDNAGPEQKRLLSRLYGERTALRERVAELEAAQATRVRLLKLAAAGRREYAGPGTENAHFSDMTLGKVLLGEAEVIDAAIKIVEGDTAPLYGLLPSWRWGEAGLS